MLLDYSQANSELLSRRQPHYPDINHCPLSIVDMNVNKSLVTSSSQAPTKFELATFLFWWRVST